MVVRLEKIQRDFLWGGGSFKKKIPLIKWRVVCSNKGKGGLGIRNLPKLNKALLGKWVWRFAQEDHSSWKRVINTKYFFLIDKKQIL